jgi:hypothetical protein
VSAEPSSTLRMTAFLNFLVGFTCGFAAALGLFFYVLISTTPFDKDSGPTPLKNEKDPPFNIREDHPTEESRNMLVAAVKHLIALQQGRDDSPVLRDVEDQENNELSVPSPSLYQLEQTFHDFTNSSKDKGKQLKNLSSLVADIGKAHTAFAKDLSRLSVHARSNIKSSDQQSRTQQVVTGEKKDNESESCNDYMDDWWKALSLCLSHMSSDGDELAELMTDKYAKQIIQICDEQTGAEKIIYLEGSKRLAQLKDSLVKNEQLLLDRDKWRVKVSSTKQVIIVTTTPDSNEGHLKTS